MLYNRQTISPATILNLGEITLNFIIIDLEGSMNLCAGNTPPIIDMMGVAFCNNMLNKGTDSMAFFTKYNDIPPVIYRLHDEENNIKLTHNSTVV